MTGEVSEDYYMYMYYVPLCVCSVDVILLFSIYHQGVGTVVSGTCLQGVIHVNDTLLLGPTSLGEFVPISIRGIHRKRLPVKEVRGGQTASFALKKVRDFAKY